MKRRGWFFWTGIGVVLLVTLNLPNAAGRALKSTTRELLAPIQRVIASYTRRLADAGEAIRGWGGLPERNRELQVEVLALRHQVREAESMERENLLLRQQLGFARRSAHTLLACEVIARDISGWWQTLRIDHGGSPDIRPGLAVISSEGLAGKVTEVSAKTAEVLLISDPTCKVSVQVGDSSAYGVLTGQGLSWRGTVLCRLDLINKNIPVRPGDPVYTSGLGGVFPKGLLVGQVEDVTPDESGLFQTATVRPKASLGDLGVVFVIAGGNATEAP